MPEQKLLSLNNPVRDYAWGDRQRLVELFGLANPDNKPQAEIWMGAHPGAPSLAQISGVEQPLDQLIASAPEWVLGQSVSQQFEGRLPFLFKVLNAGQPLSIQLHPTKTLAEAGFARENAERIPLDAAHRNYVDANHKPELICALTPFRALCGFRALPAICADLARLDSAVLEPALQRLCADADAQALQAFCQWLLQLAAEEVVTLLAQALPAAQQIDEAAFREMVALHGFYPGDRGVLFAILLNIVELAPGESLFMAPGHLHSYLGGVGLEIMASSDNVIRGGLTPKHVDCPELMNLAIFDALPEKDLLVVPDRDGPQTIYPTPVDDFALALVDVADAAIVLQPWSAEVLFCIEGNVNVACAEEHIELTPGSACLVCAEAGVYELSGRGRIARAGVRIS